MRAMTGNTEENLRNLSNSHAVLVLAGRRIHGENVDSAEKGGETLGWSSGAVRASLVGK